MGRAASPSPPLPPELLRSYTMLSLSSLPYLVIDPITFLHINISHFISLPVFQINSEKPTIPVPADMQIIPRMQERKCAIAQTIVSFH